MPQNSQEGAAKIGEQGISFPLNTVTGTLQISSSGRMNDGAVGRADALHQHDHMVSVD